MALELRGTEWRTIVPSSVFNATLPSTDNRTQFIACSMYQALNDLGRFHAKLCADEVHHHARACVGRPLVDFHNNKEGREVGHIIAADVDRLNRIWVRGAINYTREGIALLRKMRSGHYGSVSWGMATVPTRDPIDGQTRMEKHLINLAILSKPEYPEAKIYFVADDPEPVKRINAASRTPSADKERTRQHVEKQSSRSTEAQAVPTPASLSEPASMSTVTPVAPAETVAVAAATAASTTSPASVTPPTTAAVAANATPAATPAVVTPPTTTTPTVAEPTPATPAVPAVPAAKTSTEQTPAAAAAAATAPTTTSQSMQFPSLAPGMPMMTFNIGMPLAPQNQFGGPDAPA